MTVMSWYSSEAEICGDAPLPPGDKWRYLLRGLREIMRTVGTRGRVVSARADVSDKMLAAKIREGASPLRAYTIAITREVAARCPIPEGPICDVGCGPRGHSGLFEDLEPARCYFGLDVDPAVGKQAGQGMGSGRPVRFARMSAENLAIRPGSFAFVFSSSALEHVCALEPTARELARAMKPGSYGLHVVPGVWSLFLYLFHGYRRFSAPQLTALFRDAGLEVEQTWALGGFPSFLLHALWITAIETVLGHIVPRGALSLRTGRAQRVYIVLLRLSLRLDPYFPVLPAGYAILVRKP